MPILLFSNFGSTQLAGPISNVATTANLLSGAGAAFPNPSNGQYFMLEFNDQATGLLYEIVKVTNVTGDTITMVRAQEGTTGLAWSAGDLAFYGPTRGQQEIMAQVFTFAGNPNTHVAGTAASGGLGPSLCWDSTNNVFYVCVTSGPAGSAVWASIALYPGGIIGRTQVFLTSGTFTWPNGVTSAEITGWGPGGAGGASGDGVGNPVGTAGSGGGSGGFFYARVSGQTPGSTTAVTIGAAGVGVANAAVTGGSGTATSFGALATANGGIGGNSGRNANIVGGVGGSASGGTLNINGGQGGTGGPANTFDAVMPLHVYNKGGLAPYGVGTLNWFGTGVAPNGFCAGGSGASGGSAVAGGNGGPGLLIVRW